MARVRARVLPRAVTVEVTRLHGVLARRDAPCGLVVELLRREQRVRLEDECRAEVQVQHDIVGRDGRGREAVERPHPRADGVRALLHVTGALGGRHGAAEGEGLDCLSLLRRKLGGGEGVGQALPRDDSARAGVHDHAERDRRRGGGVEHDRLVGRYRDAADRERALPHALEVAQAGNAKVDPATCDLLRLYTQDLGALQAHVARGMHPCLSGAQLRDALQARRANRGRRCEGDFPAVGLDGLERDRDHALTVQHYEPWLTLYGLLIIFERNS